MVAENFSCVIIVLIKFVDQDIEFSSCFMYMCVKKIVCIYIYMR